jgi:hypothetical protein
MKRQMIKDRNERGSKGGGHCRGVYIQSEQVFPDYIA